MAFLLGLLALSTVNAAVIEHWWNISYATANPDGLHERRVIGVNGSWPAPPLSATQGDTLIVHATNSLNDASIGTSLHTHGLFFNGSNWADGAVATTQCAIPVNQTLTYEIDTTLQTGTYWIHGHYEGQYTDGLRAPFIIHPQNKTGRSDNTSWDDEYTLIVSDWYHDEYADLISTEFLNWRNPTGAEPVPKSAVIYVAHNGAYINTNEELSSGVGVSNNASLTFEPGKKYRIRIINMSSLAMFFINIDQHQMYVIETDGIEMEPYPIDTVTIAVSQRYSMLVEAKNTTGTNYAMMIMQSEDMYDQVPDDLVLNNTVQIIYDAAAPFADEVIIDEIPTLNDTDFVPVLKKEMLGYDIEYVLNVFFDTYDDGTNRASFNNITFQMPPTPSMFTALTMGNDSLLPAVYGAQTNALAYPHMANIQLTVYNWDAGFHPFHLHGHEFQVVHKSFDVTSNDTTINPPLEEGQSNPSRRDTITIPPTGSVTLRWTADNPGAWMFHCHIDWHLASGLAAIFIEAPDAFQTQDAAGNHTIPQAIYDHCAYWDQATSGNVVGLNSTSDFKGQPLGPFPLKMGWTPKAIGALAGCIITALVGFATIVFYGAHELNEREVEEEIKYKSDAKANKVSLYSKLSKRVR
ncbi:putative iron transport multicopper oxidase FET3 precursor [Naematelia encephala]|uniref:Putative iron transport multicopper oxidase FET3 n=1 Tax=Naematelia encephala TaxID=71784 RepID=A0A1Y2B239_9TREE|nr:putative iron transport multicopper oxidase FET3 precursor [Naematelia encephala]